jgi:hypothetical protein
LAFQSGFSRAKRGGAAPAEKREFAANEAKWAQACVRIGALVGFLQLDLAYRNRARHALLGKA